MTRARTARVVLGNGGRLGWFMPRLGT